MTNKDLILILFFVLYSVGGLFIAFNSSFSSTDANFYSMLMFLLFGVVVLFKNNNTKFNTWLEKKV